MMEPKFVRGELVWVKANGTNVLEDSHVTVVSVSINGNNVCVKDEYGRYYGVKKESVSHS